MNVAALLAQALRDPEVVGAIREAVAPPTDPWLSLPDAATYAGLPGHPHVLRDAVRRGELPAGRAGRAMVVRRSDVDAWLTRDRGPGVAKITPDTSEREEARAAIARTAARVARGRAA